MSMEDLFRINVLVERQGNRVDTDEVLRSKRARMTDAALSVGVAHGDAHARGDGIRLASMGAA